MVFRSLVGATKKEMKTCTVCHNKVVKYRLPRCAVCHDTVAKYRCPRCGVETCCLNCVNQHKVDNDCSGQRDKTAYVKINEINDMHLLSDYRFLEEGGRKNNNASRDYAKRRHNKPNFLRELEKQARIRNIDLQLMPYPMSRRKHNTTNYQNRLKKMFWQIEWIFPEVDLTLIDKRISEDDTLESVLDRHVGVDSDPLVKHKLKPYLVAERDTWNLFMKQDNTDSSQKNFYKLDGTLSLLENFRHTQIMEYPTIHVVLPKQCSQYHIVPVKHEACTHESNASDQNQAGALAEDTFDLNPTNCPAQVHGKLTEPVISLT